MPSNTRTSEDAVRAVIKTSLTTDEVVTFIEDANLWVNEELSDSGLSADRLEMIERYLACAFIRMKEPGIKSATYGDTTENYQVDNTKNEYLLRAAALDPTGTIQFQFITGGGRYTALGFVGKTYKDEDNSTAGQ